MLLALVVVELALCVVLVDNEEVVGAVDDTNDVVC